MLKSTQQHIAKKENRRWDVTSLVAGPNMVERVIRNVLELSEVTRGPHVATVDCDNSTIINDCMEAFLAYMAENHCYKGVEEDFDAYYKLLDEGNVRAAYIFAAQVLADFSPKRITQMVFETMEFEGRTIGKVQFRGRIIARGITPRPGVVRIIKELRAAQVKVWIVSASPQPVVEATLGYFGIEVDGVIGIRNCMVDGKYTTQLEQPIPVYEGKVPAIEKVIGPSIVPILGIGDSMGDFAMLEACQLQAVVERANELSSIAREKGWPVISGA